MTITEIVSCGGAIILVLLSLIKIKPLEVNFWGLIGRGIGKAINGEVIKKIDELEKKVDNVDKELKSHADENRQEFIKLCRQRIIRFNDEILHKQDHTFEQYNEIISDIDTYEDYCRNNPDYSNNKAIISIKNIKKVYDECLQKQSFI